MAGVGHRFKKGQSGNPGGKPAMPEAIKAARGDYGVKALARVADLTASADDEVALEACKTLLQYCLGAPRHEGAIPKDTDGKVDLATEVLLRIGLGGDVKALKDFLAAFDKEHFGPPKEEAASSKDNQISITLTPAAGTTVAG